MIPKDVHPDEASAAIRRLLSNRAAISRAELTAMRDALAAAMNAFERGTTAAGTDNQDGEIAALVD